MPKKILIFSLAYFPKHVGGAEVAIKEITDRLPTDSYEFHLICNRFDSTLPKEERVGNVLVHRIGLSKKGSNISDLSHPFFYLVKILFVPLAAYKAYRLHKKHSFSAFWCMMLYMSYPVALLRMVRFRVPYVVTLQEGDTFDHVFERWYIKLFRPILLMGIRNATRVQSISKFLNGWARQMGYKGEAAIIPNAVNTQHFTQTHSAGELATAKSELGILDGEVALVTTSRLVHKNGIDSVIKAIAKLPAHIKFVIFGTGPDEAKLKTLAAELGVADRVLFYGFIDHAVMPKYLKACDIFIRPSRSEGMGNSFLEAMAAELPVIATQEGGIVDFLFDAARNPGQATTGWAVDVNSPKQIKKAVEDIIEQPEKVKVVLVTAKQMAIEKYDWNLIAARMDKEVFQPLFMKV